MKEDKVAFKVGLFVSLTLVIAVAVLVWKSQLYLSLTGMRVSIEFENANGLLVGSDVRYRGYTVGKTLSITPNVENIIVQVLIQKDIKMPKDSYAKILFDGIVGENYITVLPLSQNLELLESGDVIPGQSSFGLANFVDIGAQNLQEVQEILVSLKETFQDEAVSGSIKGLMLNMSKLSKSLNRVVNEFTRLSINEDLSDLLENLKHVSTELKEGIDQDFLKDSKKTFKNLALISEDLYVYLNESEIKENLSKALKRGANFAEKSDNLLEQVSNIKLRTGLNYDFSFDNSLYNYHLMFDFWQDKNFLRLGLGNRNQRDALVSIQQSIFFSNELRARFGFFYKKPGLGLDYFWDPFLFELDLYDFERFYTDAAVSYPINEFVRARVGVQYINAEESSFFGGISLFRQ